MSNRIICHLGNIIKKQVPPDQYLEKIRLPSIEDYDIDQVYTWMPYNLNLHLYDAICQQYDEITAWRKANTHERELLAPILKVEYDTYGCPILYYPTFTPLIEDNEIYNYNDSEMFLIAGLRLASHDVSEKELLTFMRELPRLCLSLNLVEEDIIYNFSNIGYNPEYGLRVIDYGISI